MQTNTVPNVVQTISIVIVGAGPAGLATLAALLKDAKNNASLKLHIEIIEKRDLNDLRRRQRIIIYPGKIISEHQDEIRWDDFCKLLFDPKNSLTLDEHGELKDEATGKLISLNRRQKFIRKLERQPEWVKKNINKNFSIKDLQLALLEHLRDTTNYPTNIEIVWHDQSYIEDVNVSNKSITITNIDGIHKITFDNLIICEGEKRDVTMKVNNVITSMYKELTAFTYKKFSRQTQKYHCGVRLRLKPLNLLEGGKFTSYKEFIAQNQDKALNLDDKLLALIKTIDTGLSSINEDGYVVEGNIYMLENQLPKDGLPRVHVSCPIPACIYEIKDKEKQKQIIIEYTKIMAASKYDISEKCFEFDDKGEDEKVKLNAVTFTSELMYVDNPVRELPNGISLIVLGDCAMSPLYPLGFSSTIALQQGITISKCLLNSNLASYERFFPFLWLYNKQRDVMRRALTEVGTKLDNTTSVFKQKDCSLHEAVISDDIRAVEYHIKLGKNVNKIIKNDTPLSLAVKNNMTDIALLLLACGANPNKCKALGSAINHSNDDLIKQLFNYGLTLTPSEMLELVETFGVEALIKCGLPFYGVNVNTMNSRITHSNDRVTEIMQSESARLFVGSNVNEDILFYNMYKHLNDKFKYQAFLKQPFKFAHPKLVLMCEMLALKECIDACKVKGEDFEEFQLKLTEKLEQWEQFMANPALIKEIYLNNINTMTSGSDFEAIYSLIVDYSTVSPIADLSSLMIDDVINDLPISIYTQAIVDRFIKQGTQDEYINHLKKASALDYPPAVFELGNFYLQSHDVHKAFDCYCQLAKCGYWFGYSGMANIISTQPKYEFRLFSTLFFAIRGNYSEVYLYPDLADRILEITNELEALKLSSSLPMKVQAHLDLEFSYEFKRIMTSYINPEDAEKIRSSLIEFVAQYSHVLKFLPNENQYCKHLLLMIIQLNAAINANAPDLSVSLKSIQLILEERLVHDFIQEVDELRQRHANFIKPSQVD